MNKARLFLLWTASIASLVVSARGQVSATDDLESYIGNPVGVAGGTGGWTTTWETNSQFGGGSFLNSDGKISGTKSLGLFGSGSTAGTSVRRGLPDLVAESTIAFSMRADYDITSTANPTNLRRMAFTIRSGNNRSHFSNQLLSFYFAAGSPHFYWYDGADRTNTALAFATGQVYDVRVTLNPPTRRYTLLASNRTTGAWFTYNGRWFTGAPGQPISSVAFLMRGPPGAGNDAFLDDVSVTSATHAAPAGLGLPIREGALWRTFKGLSTPTAQGTNQWFHPPFSDATWSEPLPSGFGYGDCDDATELTDMLNSYASLFTRRAFVVTNPAAITHLTLAADYDDGFIAYLNGTEVARRNLPGGAVTHATLASGNHDSSRGEGSSVPALEEKEFIAINPALLVAGTNLLAVSGHNTGTSSSDFSLLIELYAGTSLVRGPFVQMPEPGATAAIVWKTAALATSAVDYGLDLSYSAGTVSNATLVREHTVHLTGLLPGTTYFYRVRSNGETLAEGLTFRTRPAAHQPFRFVVIGDHGQGTPWMHDIAHLINQRTDFDAMLTVGDNIYGNIPCSLDGAPGWYDPFWFTLYDTSMRRVTTFPCLGNHDWDTAQGQFMVDLFRLPTNGPPNHRGKNYSAEFGNLHIISIDTEPYEDNTTATMNEINAWIEADLAAATQAWKIALLHRPPYTTLGSHNDNIRVKANIVPRLEAGGVHVVFQGHNHWYERINPINGIHYLTTAGSGAFLYEVGTRKEYSATLINQSHSYTIVDVQGGRMTIDTIDINGNRVDSFLIDREHPFAIDGLLDNPAWSRAANGLNLHAAIRGNHLYVATQDAGEGNDHFLYVAATASTQRPANWAKSGTIMQWSAFLADENDGAFNGWFGHNQQTLTATNLYRAMTSGLNNNSTNGNGVLEGTLHIPGHFGAWPTQLLFAAAPYGNNDGGALFTGAQVPAGNGDGDLQANEFLAIATRSLALDLPVADAGSPQTVEAGMWAVVNGSASSSPATLPLTHAWTQTAGPATVTANLDQPFAAFVLTNNVASNTVVTFRLTVNDGRFDSDGDEVSVTFTPMVDTDGDGLSDAEEVTGFDNTLTPINPGGLTSNPNLADTDGDGMNDGDEIRAGTNPTNASSVFKILDQQPEPGNTIRLDWTTVSGRFYQVTFSHGNLTNPWFNLASFTATSALTRVTDTNTAPFTNRFYRIDVGY